MTPVDLARFRWEGYVEFAAWVASLPANATVAIEVLYPDGSGAWVDEVGLRKAPRGTMWRRYDPEAMLRFLERETKGAGHRLDQLPALRLKR